LVGKQQSGGDEKKDSKKKKGKEERKDGRTDGRVEGRKEGRKESIICKRIGMWEHHLGSRQANSQEERREKRKEKGKKVIRERIGMWQKEELPIQNAPHPGHSPGPRWKTKPSLKTGSRALVGCHRTQMHFPQ
jgi:hypothetical protein